MIVEEGENGVNFFRAKVGVLTQKFLGRPTVVVMFACQVDDLVTAVSHAGGPGGVESDVRVFDLGHFRDS